MNIADTPVSRCAGLAGIGIYGMCLELILLLGGCALPVQAPRPATYDFGPGLLTAALTDSRARPPILVLEMTDANPALDSTAVLYRLAYADSQQLHPYSLARWSMPPNQLLLQYLRAQLGRHYTLLSAGEDDGLSGAGPARPGRFTLRIELEEFSQLFTAPDNSVGLLRLRATVTQDRGTGERTLAQRSIVAQRPAPSADARGGVRAMTAAADAAVQDLEHWLDAVSQP